jgi:uncharacterized protein YbjT (DUF2867 family)
MADKILVLGATGFVGGRTARALREEGFAVRCMVRRPDRATDLAASGCEIVKGDLADAASLITAFDGVRAAYITTHSLSPQPKSAAGAGFMDVELAGLANILAACKASGTRRLIYMTSLGVSPKARSLWLTERWKGEQMLLHSGLDVTVIRPGMIIGRGGRGFDTMLANAGKTVAVTMGAGNKPMRGIAVDDLIYYLLGVLDEPRSFGHVYDVGNDEAPTLDQMTDIAARLMGRRPPIKIHIPRWLLKLIGPSAERRMGLPKGVMSGFLDGQDDDGVGDPAPIRGILPRPPISFEDAVKRVLAAKG